MATIGANKSINRRLALAASSINHDLKPHFRSIRRRLEAAAAALPQAAAQNRFIAKQKEALADVVRTLPDVSERIRSGQLDASAIAHWLERDLAIQVDEIRKEIDRLSTAVTTASAQELIGSAHHFRRLSRSITSICSYVAPDGRLKYNNFKLSKEVRRVAEDLHAAVQETRATISCTPPDVWVHADQEKFAQVLQNLLSNSMKYSRKGHPPVIKINSQYLDKEALSLRLSYVPNTSFYREQKKRVIGHDRSVLITIADNGRGVSKEYLVEIFEPFFRQAPVDENEEPGSGLGLAIVADIIQAHRGMVWMESIVDWSSKVFIILPSPDYNDTAK